jgi:hypothetical protein
MEKNITNTGTLKVFCIGLSRCGTFSLKTALESLGFSKCYHAKELFENYQKYDPLWIKAFNGEQVDYDELFEGFQSCADFPACYFYEEIANFFPNAKLILNTRSAESWYDSMSETILKILYGSGEVPECQKVSVELEKKLFQKLFGDKLTDKEFMVNWYNSRVEKIKSQYPSERLLVYEVSQGWEPLCKFLDLPVPEEPFPNMNNRQEFVKLFVENQK